MVYSNKEHPYFTYLIDHLDLQSLSYLKLIGCRRSRTFLFVSHILIKPLNVYAFECRPTETYIMPRQWRIQLGGNTAMAPFDFAIDFSPSNEEINVR